MSRLKLSLVAQWGLGNVPFIDPRPSWAVGVDWWRDFTNGDGNMPYPSDVHSLPINALDSNGIYQTFDTNALCRTDLGLQTAPSRTNTFIWSIDASHWDLTAVAIIPNGTPTPDGAHSSWIVFATNGDTEHYVVPEANVVGDGIDQVVSFYVKRDTANFFHLMCTGAEIYAQWDVATGALVFSGAGTGTLNGTSSENIGNGWWRFSMSINQSTGGLQSIRAYPLLASQDVPNPSEGVGASLYFWQDQIEAGFFASPPMYTAGAITTVIGNVQTIMNPPFNDGVCGFVQVDIRQPSSTSAETRIFEIDDGTSNNRIFLFNNPANGRLKFLVTIGGITSQSQEVGDWLEGPQTIAFAVSNGFFAQRRVGEADPGKFSASWPAVDRMALGGAGYTDSLNNYQSITKMVLDFGPQNAASFDAMFARAVLAAA